MNGWVQLMYMFVDIREEGRNRCRRLYFCLGFLFYRLMFIVCYVRIRTLQTQAFVVNEDNRLASIVSTEFSSTYQYASLHCNQSASLGYLPSGLMFEKLTLENYTSPCTESAA